MLKPAQPACFRYETGKVKTAISQVRYFHVVCRYLRFDGKVFGETATSLGIQEFEGASRIDKLNAFPLIFHARQREVMEDMVRFGKMYISLQGQHHLQYRGNAFCQVEGAYVAFPVDSRIMIDPARFHKDNPNYIRPAINELAQSGSNMSDYYLFDGDTSQSKSHRLDRATLGDDAFMVCSRLVCGWSFGDKRWSQSRGVSGRADLEGGPWGLLRFTILDVPDIVAL